MVTFRVLPLIHACAMDNIDYDVVFKVFILLVSFLYIFFSFILSLLPFVFLFLTLFFLILIKGNERDVFDKTVEKLDREVSSLKDKSIVKYIDATCRFTNNCKIELTKWNSKCNAICRPYIVTSWNLQILYGKS